MTNKKMPLGVDSQRHLVLNIANGYSVLTHTVTNKIQQHERKTANFVSTIVSSHNGNFRKNHIYFMNNKSRGHVSILNLGERKKIPLVVGQ